MEMICHIPIDDGIGLITMSRWGTLALWVTGSVKAGAVAIGICPGGDLSDRCLMNRSTQFGAENSLHT